MPFNNNFCAETSFTEMCRCGYFGICPHPQNTVCVCSCPTAGVCVLSVSSLTSSNVSSVLSVSSLISSNVSSVLCFRGAGSKLKVGGTNSGAKRRNKIFSVPSHFSAVPPQLEGHCSHKGGHKYVQSYCWCVKNWSVDNSVQLWINYINYYY